jgi:hypothetical protein
MWRNVCKTWARLFRLSGYLEYELFEELMRCAVALTKRHTGTPTVRSDGLYRWPARGWSRSEAVLLVYMSEALVCRDCELQLRCTPVVSSLLRWCEMGSSGGMILTGEIRRTRRKACPNATNPPHTDLDTHPGLRFAKPGASRLSYTTALHRYIQDLKATARINNRTELRCCNTRDNYP